MHGPPRWVRGCARRCARSGDRTCARAGARVRPRHATCNLLVKRAAAAGAPFLWLSLTLAIPLYAPLAVAVFLLTGVRPMLTDVLWMFGSAALNVAYFVFLQRGYRVGDLSVVYPLARGTGPVLSTAAAIAVLGERPTPIAISGAIAIAIGVVMLTGDPRRLRGRGVRPAVAWALLTGVTIAAYTLWDKRGVSVLLIPPLLYEWTSNVGRALILTPVAVRRWSEVRAAWHAYRRAVLAVAVLSPLAYILVLTALSISPVSYVAPAREIGILFGAVMGARALAERDVTRRSLAAATMVVGVIALAVG